MGNTTAAKQGGMGSIPWATMQPYTSNGSKDICWSQTGVRRPFQPYFYVVNSFLWVFFFSSFYLFFCMQGRENGRVKQATHPIPKPRQQAGKSGEKSKKNPKISPAGTAALFMTQSRAALGSFRCRTRCYWKRLHFRAPIPGSPSPRRT